MKKLLSDFIYLIFPRDDDKDYSWGFILAFVSILGGLIAFVVYISE